MKLYSIAKGNLIKGRRVFRVGSTIELSDAEAGRFREVGGELSEVAATSTEAGEDLKPVVAVENAVTVTTAPEVVEDQAAPVAPPEAEAPPSTDEAGTKTRRNR